MTSVAFEPLPTAALPKGASEPSPEGVPRPAYATTIKYENEDKSVIVGIWECDTCEWLPHSLGDRAEFFHVVAGSMVVRGADGDETTLTEGMSYFAGPGWTGEFRVPSRLTKSFCNFRPHAQGA